MAHFWTTDEHGEFLPTRVDDDGAATRDLDASVCLRRVATTPESWVLLCPAESGARVNGESVPLGLVVLSDRDELRLPGRPPRFFSTETLARVEPFPETLRGGYCPRCKQTIDCGSAAVRCPSCGLWHHASGDLPCWTYAPTCAACAQDTDPDAGFRWTPGEL
jgi:hypothetical protein